MSTEPETHVDPMDGDIITTTTRLAGLEESIPYEVVADGIWKHSYFSLTQVDGVVRMSCELRKVPGSVVTFASKHGLRTKQLVEITDCSNGRFFRKKVNGWWVVREHHECSSLVEWEIRWRDWTLRERFERWLNPPYLQ